MQVGLIVPPIAGDDVLEEQQVQGTQYVDSLPQVCSEEPGVVVESFVPEMLSTSEKRGTSFSQLKSNSVWNRLLRNSRNMDETATWGGDV